MPEDVSQLLHAWRDGDESALGELIPLVYAELRRIARRQMRGERDGISLKTSDLVHEAFLRLVNVNQIEWKDRGHFLAVAAQAMRRILVDRARRRMGQKRGGRQVMDELDEEALPAPGRPREVVELDDALTALEQVSSWRARVVELRYFLGLSVDETAKVLDLAPITVMREWKVAKAWLYREIRATPSTTPPPNL